MSATNNHLLRKVTFEIGLKKQEGAFEIQNRISNAFQSLILRDMERLFDEKVPHGQVVSIEKLEIDLGHLSSADLEQDMEKAFRRELENFMAVLNQEISHATDESQKSAGRIHVRWSNGGNVHAEVVASITDSSASFFETVTQLLLTGVAPVSARSTATGTLAEMMHKVLELHAPAFISFLRRNSHKPQLLQRLALNLTIPQLTYLLSLLGVHETPALGSKVAEAAAFLQKLNVSVSAMDLPATVRFQELQQLLWWLLLIRFTSPGAVPEEARSTSVGDLSAIPVATATHVEILTELLFVAERLSERSFFESIGLVSPASSETMHPVSPASSETMHPASSASSETKHPVSPASSETTRPVLPASSEIRSLVPRVSRVKTGKRAKNSIRDYKLSADLQKAVETVISRDQKAAGKRRKAAEEIVDPVLKSQNAIMDDHTGLLKNSLFTLPDKTAPLPGRSDTVEEIPEADTGIYINNAGLVLLNPFLKPFFAKLGLTEGKSFKSVEAQWRAAHILRHACGFVVKNDEPAAGEADMILNKLLCGIEIHTAIPETLELTAEELEETETLLRSVLQHWTIMSRSSVYALQSTFLQKKGRLSMAGSDWELLIERDSAVEILIDRLPWSIGFIKLPWNKFSILTTW